MEDLVKTSFDPAARELCSDGACIGVIGSDGRCKECGMTSPSGPPKQAEVAPDTVETAPPAPSEPAPVGTSTPVGWDSGGYDPAARELCGDGACIGVIGSDGRCKECGKTAG